MLQKTTWILLSAIFLGSGLDKAWHYDGFTSALRDYAILPIWSAKFIALPVIGAELCAGIGLLIPAWRRQAALFTCTLLLLFSAILAGNYAFGGRGMCGCWFTLTMAQGAGAHIAQNLLLSGLAFILWLELRAGTVREDRPGQIQARA